MFDITLLMCDFVRHTHRRTVSHATYNSLVVCDYYRVLQSHSTSSSCLSAACTHCLRRRRCGNAQHFQTRLKFRTRGASIRRGAREGLALKRFKNKATSSQLIRSFGTILHSIFSLLCASPIHLSSPIRQRLRQRPAAPHVPLRRHFPRNARPSPRCVDCLPTITTNTGQGTFGDTPRRRRRHDAVAVADVPSQRRRGDSWSFRWPVWRTGSQTSSQTSSQTGSQTGSHAFETVPKRRMRSRRIRRIHGQIHGRMKC